MSWITHLRSIAVQKILKQDKKWFDMPRHSPSDIVQAISKDGDDARNLISVVWGQFLVVGAMLGLGLIWALIRGWQLTLAGFAIAPVFAGVIALQTRLVVQCEVRNKKAREDVARGYYDVCSSVKMLSPDPALYGLVYGASLASSYKVIGRPSKPSCIAT